MDDEIRGTEATTVRTEIFGNFVPQELHQSRTAEFGESVPASALVNESQCEPKYQRYNTPVLTIAQRSSTGL